MKLNRRQYLGGSLALGLTSTLTNPAFAQSREATLRHVMGGNVNTLDPTIPGASRESAGLSMCIYDRLVRFGRKQVNGNWVFDQSQIIPELAQSVEKSADGLTLTFKLRPDATWHDGTPVTAEDIKWSLDRMVMAKSLSPSQMSSGSMTSPEQFVIAAADTIEIHLPEANRLALANLGLPYAIIINSKVAKEHATEDDPWALEWLKANQAGSGAYKVDAFRPGEQVMLSRNENWAGAGEDKALGFERVIIQTVPEPAMRANLVERGDADLAVDLQASDLDSLRERKIAKIVSNPQTNGFTHLSMNTQIAPFDNVKVRQAIAAALPYDDMFQAALFSRGRKLYGADWEKTPPSADFPEPMPNHTDLDKARTLLKEAGFPNGFDTTFTFAIGYAAVAEPMAALTDAARAVRRAPETPGHRLLLAELLQAVGDAPPEIAEAPGAAFDRAVALAAQERLAEALSPLLACLVADPNHVGARFSLGRLLMILGLPEQAGNEWRRCLVIDPAHEAARQALAKLGGP